jgi:hypothetical protein
MALSFSQITFVQSATFLRGKKKVSSLDDEFSERTKLPNFSVYMQGAYRQRRSMVQGYLLNQNSLDHMRRELIEMKRG